MKVKIWIQNSATDVAIRDDAAYHPQDIDERGDWE
jgi:hypothetical protein